MKNIDLIKFFLSFFKKRKTFIFILLLLTIFSLLTGMITPVIVRHIIDNGILSGDFDVLAKYSGLLLAIYVLSSLLSYFQSYLSMVFSNNYNFFLKKMFIDKIYSLDYGYIRRKNFGNLLNLLESDISKVSSFCQEIIFGVIMNLVQVTGLTIFIFYLNFKLALISIISIFVYFIVVKMSEKKTEIYSRFLRSQSIKFYSFIYERLNKIFKIKLCRREEREKDVFNSKTDKYLSNLYKISRFNISVDTLKNFIGMAGTLSLLFSGGFFVIKKEITIGSLLAFNNLYAEIFTPMSALINLKLNFHRSIVSFKRLAEFLKIKTEEEEDINKNKLSEVIKRIEIKDLSFRFDDSDKNLFDSINLFFKGGEITAIKGENGSGKTTLSLLLCGFYSGNVVSGDIFYNEDNFRDIKRSSVRERIGYIMQKPEVFLGRIEDIIKESDYDEIKAEKILKDYNLDNLFIKKGSNYEIDEKGERLSGGEKQRLHISEVLLSGEKDIYIFDEPESSQDKENRDILKDIMLKLKNNGKIVMLISHSEVFSEIVDNIFNI